MQTSIMILLALCVLLATQGYYFGFVRPTRILAWLNQAGFIFMTFVMVPALVTVLWLQSGVKERRLESAASSIFATLGISL